MRELRAWLTRVRQRQEQQPSLFGALLTGHYGAYARHRLRFFVPRLVLRLLTQGFEVFVLSRLLPWEYFAPLVSYRAATALVAGSYWGLLEGLRARVRGEVGRRHYQSARIAVEAWLGLSFAVALLCTAACAALTYGPDFLGQPGFSLFDAYAWACFLRLAFDLIARTYHAGVFAVQRVYRPLATALLPDLLELVFVAAAWRSLGPWGLPLSIVSLGVLRALLSLYYARRAYRHGRVPPPRVRHVPRSARTLRARELGGALVHALANASAQADALLLLVLAQAPSDPGEPPLAVLLYLVRPLMSAGVGWTRSFYFDWKRLEGGVGRLLLPRMRALLARVALIISLCMGGVLALVGWAFAAGGWSTPALLVLVFLARAGFALVQLEAFSLGHYKHLAHASLAFAALLGTVHLVHGSQAVVLSAGALALLAVTLWIQRRLAMTPAATHAGHGVHGFVRQLARDARSVRLFWMCADRRSASAGRVLRALAPSFGEGCIVRVGRAHLVGFAPAASAPSQAALLAAAGGALIELRVRAAESGAGAARLLSEEGWFTQALVLAPGAPTPSRAALLRTFHEGVPDGHVLELDRACGAVAKVALSHALQRLVLREIAQRAAGRRPRHRADSPYRLAVLSGPTGAEVVFVAPRDSAAFAAFRREVERASLLRALA